MTTVWSKHENILMEKLLNKQPKNVVNKAIFQQVSCSKGPSWLMSFRLTHTQSRIAEAVASSQPDWRKNQWQKNVQSLDSARNLNRRSTGRNATKTQGREKRSKKKPRTRQMILPCLLSITMPTTGSAMEVVDAKKLPPCGLCHSCQFTEFAGLSFKEAQTCLRWMNIRRKPKVQQTCSGYWSQERLQALEASVSSYVIRWLKSPININWILRLSAGQTEVPVKSMEQLGKLAPTEETAKRVQRTQLGVPRPIFQVDVGLSDSNTIGGPRAGKNNHSQNPHQKEPKVPDRHQKNPFLTMPHCKAGSSIEHWGRLVGDSDKMTLQCNHKEGNYVTTYEKSLLVGASR